MNVLCRQNSFVKLHVLTVVYCHKYMGEIPKSYMDYTCHMLTFYFLSLMRIFFLFYSLFLGAHTWTINQMIAYKIFSTFILFHLICVTNIMIAYLWSKYDEISTNHETTLFCLGITCINSPFFPVLMKLFQS